MRRLTRRGFVAASASGMGGALLAGLTPSMAAWAADGQGDHRGLADAVIEAFGRHRLVAIGESHGVQEHHDALQVLLSDPRLPEVVDDIVVEFGNSLYQPVMDRFAAGAGIANAELRQVWRNGVDSPASALDAPIYEQFYRLVRAVNWSLPARKRMRVVLGEPPIDWSKITTNAEWLPFQEQRDIYMASVVEQEVLARGRRALICYGTAHVVHAAPPGASRHYSTGGVALIEKWTGERVYVIKDGVMPPGSVAQRLAPYPRRTVIPTQGTWLESADPGFPHCGIPLGWLVDAVLYYGQLADLTMSRPNPAIYLDPVYWAELNRRNTLLGGGVDLESFRQEQPVAVPAPQGCGSTS